MRKKPALWKVAHSVSETDGARAQAFLELGMYYAYRDPDSLEIIFERGFHFAKKSGDKNLEGRMKKNYASFIRDSNPEKGKAILRDLMNEPNAVGQAAKSSYGFMLHREGKTDSGIIYALEGLETLAKLDESEYKSAAGAIAAALTEMYKTKKDWGRMERYAKLMIQTGDYGQKVSGVAYLMARANGSGDIEKQAELIPILLELRPTFDSDWSKLNHINLDILLKKESLEQRRKILDLLETNKNSRNYRQVLYNGMWLHEIYLNSKEYKKAAEICKRVLTSEYSGDSTMHTDFRLLILGKLYSVTRMHLKDPLGALNYFEAYQALRHRIMDDKKIKAVAEWETKYKTAEKEKELASKQLALSGATKQRNLFIAILLLIALAGGLVIYFLREKLLANKKLAAQKGRLEELHLQEIKRAQEIDILNASLNGVDAERKRIASDLHDGMGGLLSSIKAQLGSWTKIEPTIQRDAGYLEAHEMLEQMSREVRSVAHQLMPAALSKVGLIGAIDDYVEAIQERKKLQVVYSSNADQLKLEGELEIGIFRIIQEITKFIEQETNASTLLIQLMHEPGALLLTLEDDSTGHKEAVTIGNFQEAAFRIDYWKGEFDVDTDPNEGVAYNIKIPLGSSPIEVYYNLNANPGVGGNSNIVR